ncbi:MAG: hypothetical protein BWY73_01069 [candidate division TA06 bacterium ADurb.Bin417]|uniref:Uncharacterized protein n=1 Tax=candidate division TA06 bacterium ADurb.Bin417 TaxID=1852828 RepID=A0A1V5ME30_UNCT6|nr:MAG: hypothetical protein BWY73_01069 [candidate division TA06 bacterium ADurb.Bin417]
MLEAPEGGHQLEALVGRLLHLGVAPDEAVFLGLDQGPAAEAAAGADGVDDLHAQPLHQVQGEVGMLRLQVGVGPPAGNRFPVDPGQDGQQGVAQDRAALDRAGQPVAVVGQVVQFQAAPGDRGGRELLLEAAGAHQVVPEIIKGPVDPGPFFGAAVADQQFHHPLLAVHVGIGFLRVVEAGGEVGDGPGPGFGQGGARGQTDQVDQEVGAAGHLDVEVMTDRRRDGQRETEPLPVGPGRDRENLAVLVALLVVVVIEVGQGEGEAGRLVGRTLRVAADPGAEGVVAFLEPVNPGGDGAAEADGPVGPHVAEVRPLVVVDGAPEVVAVAEVEVAVPEQVARVIGPGRAGGQEKGEEKEAEDSFHETPRRKRRPAAGKFPDAWKPDG